MGLTAAEGTAAAVAAGSATYESIHANGGNTENIWSILLALASVIPKVLLNAGSEFPFWKKVAFAIFSVEAADKLLNALPIIGEVFAAVEVVGDIATLAEVSAETGTSPWIIANEVSLTYDATIVVSHDPDDSTFPATARSWQLEGVIDGAKVPNPMSGSINQGGKLQSTPLSLAVTAPFGGSTIQWTIVMLGCGG